MGEHMSYRKAAFYPGEPIPGESLYDRLKRTFEAGQRQGYREGYEAAEWARDNIEKGPTVVRESVQQSSEQHAINAENIRKAVNLPLPVDLEKGVPEHYIWRENSLNLPRESVQQRAADHREQVAREVKCPKCGGKPNCSEHAFFRDVIMAWCRKCHLFTAVGSEKWVRSDTDIGLTEAARVELDALARAVHDQRSKPIEPKPKAERWLTLTRVHGTNYYKGDDGLYYAAAKNYGDEVKGTVEPPEDPKPETWHDREPLL